MASGAGQLVGIAQQVVLTGAGRVVSFNQAVELKKSGSGRVISVGQSVTSTGAGSVINLAQRVRDPAIDYQFKQSEGAVLGWAGFDLIISIGSKVIDPGEIFGEISITRREGDSTLASITLLPASGSQDLSQYHGKRVLITASSATKTKLIYDGVVDVPDIDLIGKTITLQCTDSRTEKNNGLDQAFVSGVGYWSDAVFSTPSDISNELEQRLETIPFAWDYATDGTGRLTAWEPKAVPDFQLADSSIFYRNPEVVVLSRGRVTNKVTISLTYSYQLLRHRERDYSFDSGLGAVYYGAWGLPPSNIQMKQAIESAGWPYADYQFVGLDPGGRYNFYGVDVFWTPISRTGDVVPVLDKDGKQVVDQNGKPKYKMANKKTVDSTNIYANSATWKASKRWAQNITEQITITLQAPQSIQQYGEVASEVSYGVADEYDTTEWESYEAHKEPPAGSVQSQNGDYLVSKDESVSAFNTMALTALNRAKTRIIKGHRDNRVTFEVPLWSDVELFHTIETTGGTVKAKGKVSEVKHSFDLKEGDASTEIELSLSQSVGAATDSPVVVPGRPAITDAAATPDVIRLASHTIPLGGDQDPDWTGYIFQEESRAGGLTPAGLKSPVAMIVDTPTIDDASRDTKEVEASQNYDVEIRNDTLEVIF